MMYTTILFENEGFLKNINDVIPIVSPAVGWVTATQVGMLTKYVLLEHCQSVNCVSCLVALKLG